MLRTLPLFTGTLDSRVTDSPFAPVTYGFWRPLLRQLDEMFDQQASQNPDRREPWEALKTDSSAPTYTPRYELDETAEHYVMSFDVPGVSREDLAIELTGNRLLVAGERKGPAHGEGASRRIARFQQLFTLPEGITAEGIVAEHKDGVLRLAIQKPASAKATRIKIADGAAQAREGGFFKSLVGARKAKESSAAPLKDSAAVNGATAKGDSVAMAN